MDWNGLNGSLMILFIIVVVFISFKLFSSIFFFCFSMVDFSSVCLSIEHATLYVRCLVEFFFYIMIFTYFHSSDWAHWVEEMEKHARCGFFILRTVKPHQCCFVLFSFISFFFCSFHFENFVLWKQFNHSFKWMRMRMNEWTKQQTKRTNGRRRKIKIHCWTVCIFTIPLHHTWVWILYKV